jgi:hypothetical protein
VAVAACEPLQGEGKGENKMTLLWLVVVFAVGFYLGMMVMALCAIQKVR